MLTKVDQLIEKFKELKEELNKNMNGSVNPGMLHPNATMGTSGGQTGMYRSEKMDKQGAPISTMNLSEMEKQMISASPGGAQDAMVVKYDANGQWRMEKKSMKKGEAKHYTSTGGTNREANPKLRASDLGPGGKIHMVGKCEGTNEEANPTQPHNKGKFKVMPMTSEKEIKHLDAKGLPYSGKDKDVKKGEECPKCKHDPCTCVDKSQKGHIQGNEAKGFDENKAPGRGTLTV
jgi:hypothetical protein